jgi:hypothetical protein
MKLEKKLKQKDNIPLHYKENIPRVSTIIEWLYPFKWTPWEKFFMDWLNRRDIDASEYMEEASKWGTYVHNQLELYLKGEEINPLNSPYDDFVINWIEGIESLEMRPIKLEHHLHNELAQWTCDFYGYVTIDWKKHKALVDYKTYWLAKYKFGIASSKYKKPTDKLKKARIQLSIYKYLLEIKNIELFVLEIDKDNYYAHKLKYLWDKYVEDLINNYHKSLWA